jgi:phospholipid N-methyltransferase
MIEPIPEDYDGEIVELGAGTGALTLRLAETRPATRILACEINPVLARDLEARLQAAGLRRRVRVISDPAQQLLSGLSARQAKAPDFIVSGIPLGNLVNARASALVAAIHRALAPGGTYIQFQYSLLDRKKIKNKFARLRIGFVLLNIPPAFVYFAEK